MAAIVVGCRPQLRRGDEACIPEGSQHEERHRERDPPDLARQNWSTILPGKGGLILRSEYGNWEPVFYSRLHRRLALPWKEEPCVTQVNPAG